MENSSVPYRGLLTKEQQDAMLAATWKLDEVSDLSKYLALLVS